MHDQEQDTYNHSSWFIIVACVFVTCLIIANIVAVKITNIYGVLIPASFVVFPVSYIFGDILTEVYGYRRAKQVIWIGFLCNLLAVIFIFLSGILPPADFWEDQAAYQSILGFAPRLLLASFPAYLIGEFSNSFVLSKLKIATNGKWLWSRTIASTVVGQGLDSVVFSLIAFYGVLPFQELLIIIVTQWIFHSIYEAVATPFTYLVVNFLKKREGIDVYDHDTDFNPFAL